MIISRVRTQVVHVSKDTNWIFVIIETNEGVTGIGESTLERYEVEVTHSVQSLGYPLIGQHVLRASVPPLSGYGGLIHAAAVSGLDQALWDLKGKLLGVPVYELLGGALRQQIPVYANINRACTDRTPEGFGKFAAKAASDGNTAIKCAAFDTYVWRDPLGRRDTLKLGLERLASVREAIGHRNELFVECHWRFDLSTVIHVGDVLKGILPYWLEAPLDEKNAEAIHELKVRTGMRIAGGEMQTKTSDYIPLLQNRSLDIYMPDIKYMGGITGMMKANALLEAYDVLLAPHNPSGPVATAATLHAAAAIGNLLTVEYRYGEAEWVNELVQWDFYVKEGTVNLPAGPGFGVSLNTEFAHKHPFQPVVSSPVGHHRF